MAVPERISAALSSKLSGSIVAPAGYGKTETIADIVAASTGRCLVLTHTLAGVEALKKRLKAKNVKSDTYQLETIAAWALRLASSYPFTSGLEASAKPRGSEWPVVYAATIKLLRSRTLDTMITASYSLVLVDEYQDCGLEQHAIVVAMSHLVPTLIFGDPMQRIFEMGGQHVVKWVEDVLSAFPAVDQLSIPWRWKNQNNESLAIWLSKVRESLENGVSLCLSDTPSCVRVHYVNSPSMMPALERKVCHLPDLSPDNRLVIIGSKASEDSRAALAKRVQAQNVETIECKRLYAICGKIEETSGFARLQHLVEFFGKCAVGVKPLTFLKRVEAISKGKTKPRSITLREAAALDVVRQNGTDVILSLLDSFREGGRIYRAELFFALRDTLLAQPTSEMTLSECAWHVQERRRHAGRRHSYKIVASTLLVKGLEFENAVVFLSEGMEKEDLYVAFTRASLQLDIVTSSLEFRPR